MSSRAHAIAAHGVGYKPDVSASLGFNWFEIVIIPPAPVTYSSGGTYSGNIAVAYGYIPYNTKNKIIFRITQDGRQWEEEYENVPDLSFLSETTQSISTHFVGMKAISTSSDFIVSMINNEHTIIKVRKL